jgi:deoxycytidine triphosphate deaminase
MVLARKDIRELMEGQHIKIGTFDPRYLTQATYDMRLGSDVFLVSNRERGHVADVIGRPNNHSR